MLKNTASQIVCFQMISATDGSAVTSGTPTVYVLGDGGSQASGGGTATHEGVGCWSYAPTQAETNYSHVAYTMVLSGAVSQTVQTWPIVLADFKADVSGVATQASVDVIDGIVDTIVSRVVGTIAAGTHNAQSGDAYAIVNSGTHGNAALKTLIDTVDTVVDAIKVKTDNLPSDPADQSAVESAITSATSGLATAASLAIVDGIADAIKIVTDKIDSMVELDGAVYRFTLNAVENCPVGGGLDAAGVRAAIGLAAANLDSQLGVIPTVSEFEARTLPAGDYFDPAVDVVAHVTLVDTTTSNTDMVDVSGLATSADLAVVDGKVDSIILVIDKLDTMVELDGVVYRFTLNAVELAPGDGGGGVTDWTVDEKEQIRDALGIDGDKTTAVGGQIQAIGVLVDAPVSSRLAFADYVEPMDHDEMVDTIFDALDGYSAHSAPAPPPIPIPPADPEDCLVYLWASMQSSSAGYPENLAGTAIIRRLPYSSGGRFFLGQTLNITYSPVTGVGSWVIVRGATILISVPALGLRREIEVPVDEATYLVE